MRAIMVFLIGMLAVTTAAAAPAKTAAPEQIEAAASRFLGGFAATQQARGHRVEYALSHVDARLSLRSCEKELSVGFNTDPWKTPNPSLQVRCTGQQPWRIFLPTTVSIYGDVLVASRLLARGDRISADAFEPRTAQLNASRREPITDPATLTGMELRRSVRAGTVFTADLVSAPDAVQRGDHVMITAQSGGFSVSSRGKALANGRIGEQVLVENLSSSRQVKARVTAPGMVEVSM
ncbi:flagellar basal body P-ring formation chaperone FlgA [Marinobacter sp. X15-166B]|uniref:flagellar basal body P-ring formation chaperone FlgA n=1 Tax=Marinobacter sp. X15-166B TaxID=1897620 RepID=UPI00085BBA42|nr:flagellar basal body P-ring formation chaperone FlgA [Marinobacter sp. X15-166B]OEY67414.1 flagella basal body P-ring formation protein FlgA [Marinobacter sp. X15-166B]